MALICKHCGTATRGDHALPGSGWIELVLWLAYLVPGLIYSIWRRGGKPACAACGSRDLVDTATPVGRELVQQHYPDGQLPRPSPPPEPNKVVHRITVGLLWFLGALFTVTLGTAVFATLGR